MGPEALSCRYHLYVLLRQDPLLFCHLFSSKDKDKQDSFCLVTGGEGRGPGCLDGTRFQNVGLTQNFIGRLGALHFLLAANVVLAHCDNSSPPVFQRVNLYPFAVHHFLP